MTTLTTSQLNCIMDFGASYYIIFDLQNLSIHNNYSDNEDIIVVDGKRLPITHTSFITLNFDTATFTLDNVLCAPHIKRNLIFVFEFCKHNNTSIEFFLTLFLSRI